MKLYKVVKGDADTLVLSEFEKLLAPVQRIARAYEFRFKGAKSNAGLASATWADKEHNAVMIFQRTNGNYSVVGFADGGDKKVVDFETKNQAELDKLAERAFIKVMKSAYLKADVSSGKAHL